MHPPPRPHTHLVKVTRNTHPTPPSQTSPSHTWVRPAKPRTSGRSLCPSRCLPGLSQGPPARPQLAAQNREGKRALTPGWRSSRPVIGCFRGRERTGEDAPPRMGVGGGREAGRHLTRPAAPRQALRRHPLPRGASPRGPPPPPPGAPPDAAAHKGKATDRGEFPPPSSYLPGDAGDESHLPAVHLVAAASRWADTATRRRCCCRRCRRRLCHPPGGRRGPGTEITWGGGAAAGGRLTAHWGRARKGRAPAATRRLPLPLRPPPRRHFRARCPPALALPPRPAAAAGAAPPPATTAARPAPGLAL